MSERVDLSVLEAEIFRLRAERETLATRLRKLLDGIIRDKREPDKVLITARSAIHELDRAALSSFPRRITREKSDAFLRWFEENVEPAFPRQPTETEFHRCLWRDGDENWEPVPQPFSMGDLLVTHKRREPAFPERTDE